MTQDLFSMIGCILMSFVIIYIVLKLFKVQTSVMEGLTNGSTTPTATTTTTATNGEAANAETYAAAIKAETAKIQDELLISKYRSDYETAIINMSDLVESLMMKQVLNMDLSGTQSQIIKELGDLNTLQSSIVSLNNTMKWLDAQ